MDVGSIWQKVRRMLGMQTEVEIAVPGTLDGGVLAEARRDWLRTFYGKPPWEGRGKVYPTRFAASLTAYVASLAAAEVAVSCGSGGRAAWLKGQLERHALCGLRNAVQLAAAGGWVALKPFVSGSDILCDVVGADGFFVTRMEAGMPLDAVFVDVALVGDVEYLRFEKHELLEGGVRVTNRAYQKGRLGPGREVALDVAPQWAGLAPEVVIEGAERPLFTVLKMPFANTVDPRSPMPVSLYAEGMESLRELDRIFAEFLWEVKTGRRKQILDITAVEPAADGRQYRSGDQYLMLDMGGAAPKPYDDYSPEMRVAAYQQALDIQLRLLENQCQLSAGTFTFDARTGRTLTATEVISRDRTTYNTVKSIQEGGLLPGLLALVRIYDIYAALYRLAPAGRVEAAVSFGDSVFEDTGVEFERRKALADAGYIRPEFLTSWYFGVGLEEAAGMGAGGASGGAASGGAATGGAASGGAASGGAASGGE